MIPKGTKAIYAARCQMVPNAAGDFFGVTCEGEYQTAQLAPTTHRMDFTARINVEQSGDAPQIRILRDATFTGVQLEAMSIVLF